MAEMARMLITTTLISCITCGLCVQPPEWTMFMWLSSSTNEDPVTVWQDNLSPHNDAINKTPNDLLANNIQAYRNTLIDEWVTRTPDTVRILYRNSEGVPLYSAEFSTTGSTLLDWFTKASMLSASSNTLHLNMTANYTSYSTYFSFSDTKWGVERYRAATVRLTNGSYVYIVSTHGLYEPQLLPATPVDESECYFSFNGENPLFVNMTVTGMTRDYCSAVCRERDYPHGAAHMNLCACLENSPTGLTLSTCTIPCDGDATEICGGNDSTVVTFSHINTDINTNAFNGPVEIASVHTIPASQVLEVSYVFPATVYGFNFSIAPPTGGHTLHVELVLYFRRQQCEVTTLPNDTLIKNFEISFPTGYHYLEISPINVQCLYFYLYDPVTSDSISEAVSLTVYKLMEGQFSTATYVSIEASWIPATTTTDLTTVSSTAAATDNTTGYCECECWVYNLLYGDSPYNNLTYEEIEIALANVTAQIEKELTVNKSELSSTIRKLTSAEDDRTSAAAVGYSLGVALLTLTFGAILLADLPKVLGSLHSLKTSFKSRFAPREQFDLPDVTITEQG